MKPDEKIYYIKWNITCKASDRNSKSTVMDHRGTVFFSDSRFYFRSNVTGRVLDFPLDEILTVASREPSSKTMDGGNISFRTAKLNISLDIVAKTNTHLIRELIIHIAANASCGMNETSHTAQTEECPGCGALIIIHHDLDDLRAAVAHFQQKILAGKFLRSGACNDGLQV
ncbi:MAG: hypothetical protein FWF80_07625 [Defluviitaleaceae bacterium]|nr:hypothetical protein [Defluviitaleaceae bacterium]